MLQFHLYLTLTVALLVGGTRPASAESLYLYNDNFTVNNLPVGLSATAILSGRWGIWDPVNLSFIQQVTDLSANSGYASLQAREMEITLSQTDNDIYTTTTQLALAIFASGTSSDVQTNNWASASHAVVLRDPSWVVPSFNNNPEMVDFLITANTTAAFGTFNFNGGNEIFGLAVIPEPSSMSLLVIGFASALALRKRRSTQIGGA